MSALWDRLVGLRSRIQFRLFMADTHEPSADEVAYVSAHPDEIDEISEPMRLHRLFLALAIVVGSLVVGLPKYLGVVIDTDVMADVWKDFFVDIIFEAGVALIGGGVTAYFMGVLLNSQQAKTKRWRARLRAAIDRDAQTEEIPR